MYPLLCVAEHRGGTRGGGSHCTLPQGPHLASAGCKSVIKPHTVSPATFEARLGERQGLRACACVHVHVHVCAHLSRLMYLVVTSPPERSARSPCIAVECSDHS